VGKRWGTSCPTVAMLRKSLPLETASGWNDVGHVPSRTFSLVCFCKADATGRYTTTGRYRQYAFVSVEARERGGKRAQCSIGVQNAQALVVLMVTIVSTRIFPRSRGKVRNVFGDKELGEEWYQADGFVTLPAALSLSSPLPWSRYHNASYQILRGSRAGRYKELWCLRRVYVELS
jgi:hypothetical protein